MINILYGKSGSGKTKKLLTMIKSGAETKRKQIIFVPETKTFEMEKTVLSMFSSGACPYAEVYSLTRYAGKFLSGRENIFIDEGARLLICKKAVDKCRSAFSFYTKGNDKTGFYQKMLQSFVEMETSGVTPQMLYNAVEHNKAGIHIKDIASAYTLYIKECENAGFVKGDILVNAGEKLQNMDLEQCDIYFDGYTGFTYSERIFIEQLAKKCENMTFAIMTDGKNSLFAEQNKTVGRLNAMAEKTNHSVNKLYLEKQPYNAALDFLGENIFEFTKDTFDACDNIAFIYAETAYEECSRIAAEIRSLVMTKNFRYKDIAIVCGEPEIYEAQLKRSCQAFDVPIYVSDKTKILSKPVISAVIGGLNAIKNGFQYEYMFSFLKSGLLKISEEMVCKLENYVICWNIRGSLWERDFENPIRDYNDRTDEEELAQLKEINDARRAVMEPLIVLKDDLKRAKEGREYILCVKKYIESIGLKESAEQKIISYYDRNMQREALEYAQLYEILNDAFDHFDEVSGNDTMDTDQFIELISLLLSKYSIATVPATIDSIILSDFRNTSLERPKAMFMIGCNDSLLPVLKEGASLISEKDRMNMAKEGIELSLTGEERQIELESHIYRAFCMPSERLYMSFSSNVNGKEERKSYILNRAEKMMTGALKIETSKENGSYMLNSKDTAFALAAKYLSGEENENTYGAYRYFERQNTEYFDNINRIKNATRGPIMRQDTIKGLYGDKLNLSASRIEKISSCPFAYFMEYGLKAKERKRIDFDAKAVGSFMHELVEKAVKEYVDNGRDGVERAVKRAAEEYVLSILKRSKMTARLKVILENIAANSQKIIAGIIDEIEKSDFKPMFCELSFGENGVDAYEFKRNEITVRINGKIDRVDGYVKDGVLYLKIVDYKTGIKKFKLSDLLYGLNVQMFLYMMMLKSIDKIGYSEYKEKQAAAVMYLPLRSIYKAGYIDEDAKEDNIKREGYILDDPDIIDLLERPTGGKYAYLPLSFKKDGSFSVYSSILSGSEFGMVFEKIKRDLYKITDAIQSGHIEAAPYYKGEQLTACTYCQYHMACRFDESMKHDKYIKIKAVSDRETLKEMQEEA